MRLYTYQSFEVVSQLWQDKVYRPSWDRCVWLVDPDTRPCWEPAYRWLVEQYNQRRPQFATPDPLVWWYTDINQARRELYHDYQNCLFGADVPDERILLQDADLWYNCLGSNAMFNISVEKDCDTFDRWWEAYKKPENREAMEETWKHVFHLPRRDRHNQTVHAITDCIRLEWVENKSRETLR